VDLKNRSALHAAPTTPPFGHPSLIKEGSLAVAQAVLPVPKASAWRTGKSACATDPCSLSIALLIAQRHDRIDLGRPAGRNISRQCRDQGK
jgi:hypothetical protein